MKLKDKVCIITGSGSGQGRAAALLFAKEGAKVVGADINDENGLQVVDAIKKEGGLAKHIHVDVTKSQDVENMVKFAVDQYGKVDVLYNNAGTLFGPTGASLGDGAFISDITEENWDKIQTINLKSVFLCCKYAIPALVKNGSGSIINVASAAALIGGYPPNTPKGQKSPAMPNGYAAAKGAVIALSRAIAMAYAKNQIRSNVLLPGSIETPFHKSVNLKDPAIRQVWEAAIPMQRMGTAEDVSYAALYLASDESAYITGIVLPIDGGWLAY